MAGLKLVAKNIIINEEYILMVNEKVKTSKLDGVTSTLQKCIHATGKFAEYKDKYVHINPTATITKFTTNVEVNGKIYNDVFIMNAHFILLTSTYEFIDGSNINKFEEKDKDRES